jgi:fructoselysine 6-kinase
MALVCVGDNVVDLYTSLGWVFPGGNAVNVAVAARRAGQDAAYLGAVGSDRWGEVVFHALSAEHIDVARVRVIQGPNAYSTVEVVDGDRVFGPADIGVSRITLSQADKEYLSGFAMIHTGDNSMLEPELDAIASCAPVSYDFGERPGEYWEPLIRMVKVACFSAGSQSPDAAEELAWRAASFGPDVVLVTEGARGALALDKGGLHRVAATATELVDSLGAGDSLTGAFLAGLLEGEAAETALRSGIAAAAATCRTYGAFGYGVAMSDERDPTAIDKGRAPMGTPVPHKPASRSLSG